jgi:hypothetical protein
MEIQRRSVAIAIRRVDQTREVLNEPPPPPQPGQPVVQLGPTAALNLLTALNDFQSSQNNFMSVWLNYYATRMRLVRELGIMQLDERGVWIDTPLFAAERASVEELPVPPAVPRPWLHELEVPAAPAPVVRELQPAEPVLQPIQESTYWEPETPTPVRPACVLFRLPDVAEDDMPPNNLAEPDRHKASRAE